VVAFATRCAAPWAASVPVLIWSGDAFASTQMWTLLPRWTSCKNTVRFGWVQFVRKCSQ